MMILASLIDQLALVALTPLPETDVIIRSGYASDLLSDVLGRAQEGAIWVTLQCHPNVIAVAALLNLAAVLVVGGIKPEEAIIARAKEASVIVLSTQLSTFEIVGQLYQLGIKGDATICQDG